MFVKTVPQDKTVTKFVTKVKYALVRMDGLAMIESTVVLALIAVVYMGSVHIAGHAANAQFNDVNVAITKITSVKTASKLRPEVRETEFR